MSGFKKLKPLIDEDILQALASRIFAYKWSSPADCYQTLLFESEQIKKKILEESNRRRGEAVSQSFKVRREHGMPLGRPRSCDFSAIDCLRDQGMSVREIAKELDISRGSVQHALKKKREPDGTASRQDGVLPRKPRR